MKTKLTAELIASIEAMPFPVHPPVDSFWWDDDLTGFGLKISPTGKRSWVYQYNNKSRLTLGPGSLPVEDARGLALEYQRQIHVEGRDPAKERREVRAKRKLENIT